jgi:hypothetical protein
MDGMPQMIDIFNWLLYCLLIFSFGIVFDPLYGVQVLFAILICLPIRSSCDMGGEVREFSGCDWSRSAFFVKSDLK